jgi:hypothetical protein
MCLSFMAYRVVVNDYNVLNFVNLYARKIAPL